MIEVDKEKDLNSQLKSHEKVLALFYASWCPHCKSFVPKFDRKVLDCSVGNVIHVLLDDYDNPLWDEYDVKAVPTIIYFCKGKVSSRLDGRLGSGLNEKQLNEWLQGFKSP